MEVRYTMGPAHDAEGTRHEAAEAEIITLFEASWPGAFDELDAFLLAAEWMGMLVIHDAQARSARRRTDRTPRQRWARMRTLRLEHLLERIEDGRPERG